MESDIMDVLFMGCVRVVYFEDYCWLVCGYFEVYGIWLLLYVVVQYYCDGYIDIVIVFVFKNFYYIISCVCFVLFVCYDDEQVCFKEVVKGNKVGYKGKGGWK